MAIIVSKNNRNAEKLDPEDFSLESNIQEYVLENPNVIPLYDISEDTRLFVAAREFRTTSGPIDALGFDEAGNIYVIETKLYRNPDKRTVVAQALDYGASLWKNTINADEFIAQLNAHSRKTFDKDFTAQYAEFFGIDDASSNIEAIIENLNAGNIKFVVLMDKLHDALKDLILYVNQNSKFDIYAVELEYYKHAEFEIMIPKLFGDEVKKEVVSTKSSANYTYIDIDASQFEGYVNDRQDISPQGKKALLEMRGLYDELIDKYRGSSFYFYSPKADRAGYGVNDSDGKQAGLISSNGEIWVYQRGKTGSIAEFNKRVLHRLIDEGIVDKTEKNLETSQWSVRQQYFAADESNVELSKQLRRFIEICREEYQRND